MIRLKIKLLQRYGLNGLKFSPYTKPILYCDEFKNRQICFKMNGNSKSTFHVIPNEYSNKLPLDQLRINFIFQTQSKKWKNCETCNCFDKFNKKKL